MTDTETIVLAEERVELLRDECIRLGATHLMVRPKASAFRGGSYSMGTLEITWIRIDSIVTSNANFFYCISSYDLFVIEELTSRLQNATGLQNRKRVILTIADID